MYQQTIDQFSKTLKNLSQIIDKAAQYADEKKFDANILWESRLAPDQFNLIRQVQIACDTAKGAAASWANKEAPVHADNEKTLADLKNRIDQTVAYLKTFSVDNFAHAGGIKITRPRWEGKYLSGEEFLHHFALPNFYFHITTAYSILRHNGVSIGKKDFLGEVPFKS